MIDRVPCLTSSLVWVSFRSHGRLQHGRRPEGPCRQRPLRLPSSCWRLVSFPLLDWSELENGRENPAEERTAPFVLRVPWLRPTYFVFQSSFLHSVGWKIHVWSLEGSDAALSQSCLRMLREEGDRECKIILPYPTPTALPLLHLLLNLGIFFF